MKKFNFRLQKVLEYREMLETWAKEAFLDARTTRLEAELSLHQIGGMRAEVLGWKATSLDDLRTVELHLKKLSQREIEQQIVVNVLIHEEELASKEWTEKKIELKALQKVYDKQYGEWQQEMDRKLQIELDEWALRKRAA